MLSKLTYPSLTLVAILISSSLFAQFGSVLLEDNFDQDAGHWTPIGFDNSSGNLEINDGGLSITNNGESHFGAYYSPNAFSGHFEVEIDFNGEHGVALGLLKSVAGSPSLSNYSMLKITQNEEGDIVVQLEDKQFGGSNIFDNTNSVPDSRYTHLLNGKAFSIPYKKTNGKLRILRHEREQFLHFYYGVEKEINGKVHNDWMELSQSREWGAFVDSYFIALFSLGEAAQFANVEVRQLPHEDQDDTSTGFAITERPYTWSGYTDSALVVTFGEEFAFSAADHKFVFWQLANYVPVWHLDNSKQFTYGFVETWGGGNEGCHEPMSDRLLGYSELKIIEDNEVRKVVKWSYELVNPDYKIPTNDQGEQRPEAVEYYYIYADGSIIRKIEYTPKLDTDFRNWHEIMEMILIAGENQRPGDLLEYPSLTFQELDRSPVEYNTDGQEEYRNNNQPLGATTLTAHVQDAPEIFNSFSDDRETPETFTELPLNYEITWHYRGHNFGHWPINKEPYRFPCKSWSAWPQQVAHTSLVGMGLDEGQDWSDRFLERADGRPYREWISLIGMNERNGSVNSVDKTNSWLYPGEVEMINDSSLFIDYSFADKYFEFATNAESSACHFAVAPRNKLVNPVIRINDWKDSPVDVSVNGSLLSPSNFLYSIDENGDLLLMILGVYTGEINVVVAAGSVVSALNPSSENLVNIYPNPATNGEVILDINGALSGNITVFSASGSQVTQGFFTQGNYTLNIDSLTPGVYVIRVEDEAGVRVKKLFIQ